MFKNIFFVWLLTFLLTLGAKAQLIDYIQGYVGTRIFPSDQQLNAITQLPENFYAGFAPGQVLGGSLYRQVTDHTCIGAGVELSNTGKPNFNLNITTINASAKYNFNNIESFISPYVMGGLNLSFVSILQQAFESDVIANTNGVDTETKQTFPTGYKYREPYTNLLFVPVVGAHAGAGLDFKITEGWGLYGQYTFYYNLTNNTPILKETFQYNKSNMLYHNFTVGIRFFL